jgi:hypothetical protein
MSVLPLKYGPHDARAVTRHLAYASFVSVPHKLLFVETPKVCSSTMKWLLAELAGTEVPLQIAERETHLTACIHDRTIHSLPALTDLPPDLVDEVLTSPDYIRVCAVRNPYARLVSAWSDKIRLVEPGFEQNCQAALRHARRNDGRKAPSFREFARWVVETNDPARCDAHWRRQTSLIFPDLIDYNFVIRTESFGADVQRLLAAVAPELGDRAAAMIEQNTCNISLPVRWSETYDEALAAEVADFYDTGFATFGYSTESWKELVAKPDPAPADFEVAALDVIRERNAVIREWNRRAPIYPAPPPNWSATSLLKAAARWLMRYFSSAASSAKVLVRSVGTNTGS